MTHNRNRRTLAASTLLLIVFGSLLPAYSQQVRIEEIMVVAEKSKFLDVASELSYFEGSLWVAVVEAALNSPSAVSILCVV